MIIGNLESEYNPAKGNRMETMKRQEVIKQSI